MADNTSFDPRNLTPELRNYISNKGLDPYAMKPLSPDQQSMLPYTTAGASNLQGIASLPIRQSVDAVTMSDPSNRRSSFVLFNPESSQDASQTPITLAHEMEHVLSRQSNTNINSKWDELTDDNSRYDVVDKLIQHAPYLVKNWGLSPVDAKEGYFSPDMQKYQGHLAPNLLAEQLATLSALEQAKGKRLTDDPYVRDNILTTREQREAYNALTGLRQTRLDSKDLPPYTRVEDEVNDPSMATSVKNAITKVKKSLGFYKGGNIDKPFPGGKKDI